MKRFLISAIAIIAMSTAMLAQVTICDEPCAAADPSEVEFSTSLLPYSPTSFETMYLGTPVDQCITIQCPSAISLGVSIAVESIELKDVINVPEGLSYCVSTDFVNAEEYCTIRLQGTPTTAGTYNLKLRLYVNSSSMVASVINRLTDTDSGYSIGISFEVVDENAETQPTASFTTNPEASIDIASLDLTSKVRITQGATVNYNSTCVDA
ncbi:MAG: hypothetical protein HUK15_03490, partial [Bacteroidales bacterium]|nr:hypothetical protein [Bacteroidales bacterium]